MSRKVPLLLIFILTTIGHTLSQTTLPTLDIQQFPRSPMLWLTPQEGHVIPESTFFEQPGIAEILSNCDHIALVKVRQGSQGITHRRYQQFHGGKEVEGAIFHTHALKGNLTSANGQLACLPDCEEPALSDLEATYIVQDRLRMLAPIASEGDDYIVSKVNLIYTPTTWETQGAPLEYRLAYRIGMAVLKPYSSTISYVDAHTGEIFRMEEGAMSCAAGNANTLYHGWQPITTKFYNFLGSHYELRDECRGERIHTRVDNHEGGDSTNFYPHSNCDDLNDGDNIWQAPEQRPAASLHWAAEMYHDYLGAKLSLNGLDGNGVKVKLVYHPYELREYTSGSWPNWNGAVTSPFNASWDISLEEGHFGRGDGIAPWVSLDVVSHELTHAMMNYEYDQMLRGGNESRALNESFADIFSVCSEFYNLPLHDPNRPANFTFGEDVANGPIRSMAEPWVFNCPRTYQAAVWQNGNTAEPHRFSSVQTYWFYLLAFGSAGNPTEANITVCGIGMDNAAHIAYRMITDYMIVGVTHQDAQQAAVQAAENIFGMGSFEATQCANAWAAVGIGNGANFCNPVGTVGAVVKPMLTLTAFPNPTASLLTVLCVSPVKESKCSMELWSSMGTKVASLAIPTTILPGKYSATLDCGNLAAGTYILVFTSDHAHICKNIVIN
jgi:Zn-dependent metalloprotease